MSKYIIENLNPLADVEVKIYKVSANATLNIPPNFQFLDPLNNSAVVRLGYVEPEIAPEANEMFFTTSAGQLSYQGHPGDYITLSDGEVLPVEQSGPVQYTSVPAGKHKVTLIEERDGYAYIAGEALTEVHNFPSMPTLTSIRFYTDVTSPNLVKVPNALPSSITDTSFMFYFATNFNSEIANWDVSHVTNMSYMFYGAATFNQPIGDWNTAHVSNMTGMFHAAESFNQDITQWCVGLILNTPTNFNSGGGSLSFSNYPLWSSCPRGENIITDEINFLTTDGTLSYKGEVGDVITLGGGAGVITVATNDITEYQVTGGRHKLKLVNDRTGYLGIAGPALTEVLNFPTISSVNHVRFNTNQGAPNLINVSNILPANITNISNMFDDATRFNQDISMWDTSNVFDMSNMFFGASVFNQPLNTWNVSNVTDMGGMFCRTYAFNQPLDNWNTSNVTTMLSMFQNASIFNQDISKWNVSKVTKMGNMFVDALVFNQPLNTWDTSNVTDMSGMFRSYGNHTKFNQPIGNWNTAKVTNMEGMFEGRGWYATTAFNQDLTQWCVPLILSEPTNFVTADSSLITANKPVWGTCPSEVVIPQADEMYFTTTDGTLSYQGYLGDVITLSDGTTHIVNSVSATQYAVPAGKHKVKVVEYGNDEIRIAGDALIEVHNFVTLSTYSKTYFYTSIPSPNLVKVPYTLPSNLTNLSRMFYLTENFNQDISSWDTSHVTNMSEMFSGTYKFNQPLNTWNVSNVTDMSWMFAEASAFNQDIGSWNVSHVTNMTYMFYGATIFNKNLSQWCVGLIPSLPNSFKDGSKLSTANTPKWGTCPRGENIGPSEMLFTTTAGTLYYQGYPGDKITLSNKSVITIANGNIRTITVPAGKHKVKFVEARSNFVALAGSTLTEVNILPTISAVDHIQFYCDNGGSPNLTKVPTTLPSNLTNLSNMFRAATYFNQDISTWNTVNVTNISGLFWDAVAFNQNINSWDVSNVLTMEAVFYSATLFNQPLNNWDTSNVNFMYAMFNLADAFNQDISSWNVSNVTNMYAMFNYAASFNQDIGLWDTSQVSTMDYMLYGAETFNQDLSQWCVPLILSIPIGFNDGGKITPERLPVWGSCPRGEDQL